MLHREYFVDNGGYPEKMLEFECDNCGKIMCCSWPRVDHDGKNYCGDCALILKIIDGFYYAKTFWYSVDCNYWGEIIDGVTHLYTEKMYKAKIKREKEGKSDKRNSPEYKFFRKSVFERDDYTCQHCKNRGGELNVHHIKSYKNDKKLRTEITNGVTLCVECHKKEHRRLNDEKIKSRD